MMQLITAEQRRVYTKLKEVRLKSRVLSQVRSVVNYLSDKYNNGEQVMEWSYVSTHLESYYHYHDQEVLVFWKKNFKDIDIAVRDEFKSVIDRVSVVSGFTIETKGSGFFCKKEEVGFTVKFSLEEVKTK